MAAPFLYIDVIHGLSKEDTCRQVICNYLASADDFSQVNPSLIQSVLSKYGQADSTKIKFAIIVEFFEYAGSSLEVSKDNALQAKYLATILGLSDNQLKACWNIARQKVISSYQSSESTQEADGDAKQSSTKSDQSQPTTNKQQPQTINIDQSTSVVIASLLGPIVWLLTGRKDYIKFISFIALFLLACVLIPNRVYGIYNVLAISFCMMTIIKLFATIDIGLRSDADFVPIKKRHPQTAIAVAAFFSYYTWAYTCGRDKDRFLVVYAIDQLIRFCIVGFLYLSGILSLLSGIPAQSSGIASQTSHYQYYQSMLLSINIATGLTALILIGIWLWATIDANMRCNDKSVYDLDEGVSIS